MLHKSCFLEYSSSSAYACRPKAHLTAAHFPSGPCGSCCSSSCCLQLLSVLAEMPEQAVNLPHFQTGEGQCYKCEQTLLAIVLLFVASGFATAFRIAVGRDPWKILPDSHTVFSRISYDLVILPTPLSPSLLSTYKSIQSVPSLQHHCSSQR